MSDEERRVSANLPLDLYERLEVQCVREERTLSVVIRRAVREYLDKHEGTDREE